MPVADARSGLTCRCSRGEAVATPCAAARALKYDAAYEEDRLQRAKQERLDEYEAQLAARRTKAATKKEKEEAADFGTKLATRILANLQLSLTNVHIRYEDSSTEPGRTLAIGATIGKLTIGTTGADWQPTFVKKPGDEIYKVLALEALALYWNMDTVPLGRLPAADLHQALQALIATKDNPAPEYRPPGAVHAVRNRYLLRPFSAACRLRLNTTLAATPGQPKVDAQLAVEAVDLELHRRQYHQAVMLVGVFAAMVKAEPYRRFHPPPGVRPKKDPRAWWKFAINSVLSTVHERAVSWTWARFAERRRDRLAYVQLYRLVLQGKDTKASRAEQAALERRLAFEDIRLYRQIATAALKREKAEAKARKAAGKSTKTDRKRAADAKPPPAAAATPAAGADIGTYDKALPALPPGVAGAAGAAKDEKDKEKGKGDKKLPSWLTKLVSKTPAAAAKPADGKAEADAGPAGAAAPTPAPAVAAAAAAAPAPGPAPAPAAPTPLELEEELVAAPPFPLDYVWLVLDVDLARVSLSLRGDGVLPRGSAASVSHSTDEATQVHPRLVSIALDRFGLRLAQMVKSTKMALSLQSLLVSDSQGAFVAPKAAAAAAPAGQAKAPPLFAMDFEHAPLDGRADDCVRVALQPLEISYNKATVDQVIQFLTPPEDAMSVVFLRDALNAQLNALHQMTRASLEYLVSQHKVGTAGSAKGGGPPGRFLTSSPVPLPFTWADCSRWSCRWT